MKYYKSSQFIPSKGNAYTYYECDDANTIQRYVTFIPGTGEVERVGDPLVKELYNADSCLRSSQDEFEQYWPPDVDAAGGRSNRLGDVKRSSGEAFQYFDINMTVDEAMQIHPRVREVFAAFHLGGCGHCAIGQWETIGQVCMAYGVDPSVLLEVLEGLMESEPATESPAG